ncbi:MAG: hypothetical protein ACLURV_14970 [Gallintestinimicrobium sp.]
MSQAPLYARREYASFTMIAAGAAYIRMAIVTLIANARYLLMSCASAGEWIRICRFS